MVYPPPSRNISIPAVVAGNILESDDTSISAIDSGYDGAIVMRTQNKLALLLNPDQRASFNSENATAMMTVNSDHAEIPPIRLSYLDSFYYDASFDAVGNITFLPNCDDPFRNRSVRTVFKKNVDIADHDGVSVGLVLGGQTVTASATELNYVDVPVGIAVQHKALVLDDDRSMIGVNHFGTTTLSGTLMTDPQPNITELQDINVHQLRIQGDVLDVTPKTIRYLSIHAEGQAEASKAMILDSKLSFTGLNYLNSIRIDGTLTTGNQPFITNVGELRALTTAATAAVQFNSGITIQSAGMDHLLLKVSSKIFATITCSNIGVLKLSCTGGAVSIDNQCDFMVASHDGTGAGLWLGSRPVMATADELNAVKVNPGVADAGRALILDGSKNITGINAIGATSIAATVTTSAQPFINAVSTLNVTKHDGKTQGLSLGGVLVTATATNLNSMSITSPGTAEPNRAMVLDASKSISGVATLDATYLTGTITTPYQPRLLSVNTLAIEQHNGTVGLKLGSTVVTATGTQLKYTMVEPGKATASHAIVLDGLKNIYGIGELSANSLIGTLATPQQPNLTSVNVLNIALHDGKTAGLSLNGLLVAVTATQLNRLDAYPGIAGAYKAVVLDGSSNIDGLGVVSARTLGGVVRDALQPNIKSLSTLNLLDHDGQTTGLSLKGVLVTATAEELNYVDVQKGVAADSKALVLDYLRNISNINRLSASQLAGTLITNAQPNISSVTTLNITSHDGTKGLALNGILVTATGDQLNRVNTPAGVAAPNKALVSNDKLELRGLSRLSSDVIDGQMMTAFQPFLLSVQTLEIKNHDGATMGLALNGQLVTSTGKQLNFVNTTEGVAVRRKAMILDDLRNITHINSLTATMLVGQIATASQPSISSVNALDITKHDGLSTGLKLGGTLVKSSAAQLNTTAVVPGTATAKCAMVLDAYSSITGISTIQAERIRATRLDLAGVIANLNVGSVIIKSYSSANLVGRMVDIQLIDTLRFSNFFPAGLTD